MIFLYYYFLGVKIEGGNGVRYDHWRGGEKKKGGRGTIRRKGCRNHRSMELTNFDVSYSLALAVRTV